MRDIRPTGRKPQGDSTLPPNVPILPPGRPLKKQSSISGDVPVSANRPATAPPPMTASVPAKEPPFARKAIAKTASHHFRIGRRERAIVGVLFILAIITGILATVIFLPAAQVRLSIRTAPLLVDEKLTLTSEQAVTSEVIPGSAFFREVQVDGTSAVTSTTVIGEKASGNVVIINRSTSEQKIKSESRLVTEDGKLFFMQEAATLPPGPSQVSVPVIAAEAGEAGNIEPQRLNFVALDASSQSLVYAEATTALQGGSGETVPIVQDADVSRAQEAAQEAARAQVEDDIRSELPKGWSLLDESWDTEIVSFDTEATVGDQITHIPYTARVTVRVMGYEPTALEERLRQALESRMDEGYMLFPGPISFSKSVQDINWEESVAHISARVTHTTIPALPLETLREKILGRSEAEARQYLEGLPGVQAVELTLSPFWVTSVPRIESRVKLDLQSERQP